MDLSQDKYADVFKKSMEKWQDNMAKDIDGSKFGFVDIEGIDLPAYGTPYTS